MNVAGCRLGRRTARWCQSVFPVVVGKTLALGLQCYQSQSGGTEWHYLMAASTLVILPVIVLFLLAQRSFIEGISMTGIKG